MASVCIWATEIGTVVMSIVIITVIVTIIEIETTIEIVTVMVTAIETTTTIKRPGLLLGPDLVLTAGSGRACAILRLCNQPGLKTSGAPVMPWLRPDKLRAES
jgi:hypothetical protein